MFEVRVIVIKWVLHHEILTLKNYRPDISICFPCYMNEKESFYCHGQLVL